MDPSDYRERYLRQLSPSSFARPKATARSALLSLVDKHFPNHDNSEIYVDTLGRSDLLRLIEHCGVTPVNQRITGAQVLAGIQALRDAGDQRQTTIDRLYSERAQWQAETERARTELATREQELTTRQGEIEKLRSDILELHSMLAAIYESTSWRITQPIRWLRSILRH